MSTATRLESQTADDVAITGGRISGVRIAGSVAKFAEIHIAGYRLYVGADGDLMIETPDGAAVSLVAKSKSPPGQAKKA